MHSRGPGALGELTKVLGETLSLSFFGLRMVKIKNPKKMLQEY